MFSVFVRVSSLVYMSDNPYMSILEQPRVLTVDCNVTCGNVGSLGFGVVRFGCIGEIICCVVVTIVSTISSFIICDGV